MKCHKKAYLYAVPYDRHFCDPFIFPFVERLCHLDEDIVQEDLVSVIVIVSLIHSR